MKEKKSKKDIAFDKEIAKYRKVIRELEISNNELKCKNYKLKEENKELKEKIDKFNHNIIEEYKNIISKCVDAKNNSTTIKGLILQYLVLIGDAMDTHKRNTDYEYYRNTKALMDILGELKNYEI